MVEADVVRHVAPIAIAAEVAQVGTDGTVSRARSHSEWISTSDLDSHSAHLPPEPSGLPRRRRSALWSPFDVRQHGAHGRT